MRRTLALAAGLLAFQAFHVSEHALQTWQKYVLHDPDPTGMLGHLLHSDWLHFLPNVAYFAGLLLLTRLTAGGPDGWTRAVFAAGLAAAGYHAVEHTVKLWQSQALGHTVSHGILGYQFELIPLHLWLNAIVLGLTAPHLVAMLRPGTAAAAPSAPQPPSAA